MYDGRRGDCTIPASWRVTIGNHKTSLGLFGGVQFLAISADRLKQFSFISLVGLFAPGSSTELLKLNLFMQVPMLVLTPLVGTLLDRWSRSEAIVGACISRAALLISIPALLGWSHSLYSLYAVASLLAVADLVFAPARSALLPEIVGPAQLHQANAVFWALGVVGTLLGFLAGGWLFDFYSWHTSFFANSFGYLAAAALMTPVALLHGPVRGPVDTRSIPAGAPRVVGLVASVRVVVRSIADSIRLIRSDRHIAVSLTTQSALFAVGGVLSVIAIARIQEVAPAGHASFLSMIAAALVVGMIVASGLSSLFRDRVSVQRSVAVATILCGVAITGLGRSETLVPLCIWSGLLGTSISPVFIVTETLIQHQSPKDHLGRVFTAREALIKTAFLGAAALATAANTVVSKPVLLVSLGLFLALLGVVLERSGWIRADTDGDEVEYPR